MDHEEIRIVRGPRTGLPVLVGVHSTALGQALGGCRIKAYPEWRDALTDVLRLSAAMTDKCAVAGLPHGGGKTVVALPPGRRKDDDVLRDVGDVIESFGGRYATGPDVGTGPADMDVIAERTRHVFCRPGGSGDSSAATAAGVMAALRAVLPDLSGRSAAIIGLGRVGGRLARMLAAEGAKLITADIDPANPGTATPEEALTADVDVLIPAAVGGLLTREVVPRLRCRVVLGPANNQLDEPATADLLHSAGILWVPDFVVSAGGVINATAIELRHETPDQAARRVAEIGDTVRSLLAQPGTTPYRAARDLARRRLGAAAG